MSRSILGIAKFYHRDSEGKGEFAPSQYVKWACQDSKNKGLKFDGTPDVINEMIKQNQHQRGDLFLDYGVRGRDLNRPGLNALMKELRSNLQVSHLYIPLRDRLSRPQDPIQAVTFENAIQRLGITIVYQNKTLPPLRITERANIMETTNALWEFEESGKFSRDLARKLIRAKLGIIEHGAAIGGTPPYGFDRWLAIPGKIPERKLKMYERAKLPGHHIFWLPNPEQMRIVIRIIDLCKIMTCTDIAIMLTEEGIPTPQSWRTGSSGVWNRTTVRKIATNPIYTGVYEYGKRAEGKFLRMTPDGPRELVETDLDEHQSPKRLVNPVDQRTKKILSFAPVVGLQSHLDAVASIQKRHGKPRQKGDGYNPLGCRIYDRACGWRMYRKPRGSNFRYACGAYSQSDGKLCNHNTVDGERTAGFVARMIRQIILTPGCLTGLKNRIHELATQELGSESATKSIEQNRSKLSQIDKQLKNATRNLANAESDEEANELRLIFKQWKTEQKQLEEQIKSIEASARVPSSVDQEVKSALSGIDRLKKLVESSEQRTASLELFQLTNAFLYVGFVSGKRGKKKVNLVDGGLLTLGASAPPIPIYDGQTEKAIITQIIKKGNSKSLLRGTQGMDSSDCSQNRSEREGMLGNEQRCTHRYPGEKKNQTIPVA